MDGIGRIVYQQPRNLTQVQRKDDKQRDQEQQQQRQQQENQRQESEHLIDEYA